MPFDDIVKVTVYLTNLADLDAVNEVYTTFFPIRPSPAAAHLPAPQRDRGLCPAAGCPGADGCGHLHGDGTPPQLVEEQAQPW